MSISVVKTLAATLHSAVDQDQHASANNCDDELTHKSAEANADQTQQEVSNDGTYDAEDDVHDQARIEAHYFFRKPSGNAAEDDLHDDSVAFHFNTPLKRLSARLAANELQHEQQNNGTSG